MARCDMDIPPYAVICWADSAGVYVELPWQGSYTRVTFPPTIEGLKQALSFLQAKQPKGPPQVVHTANHRAEAQSKLAKLGFRL